jgi:peptide/nickel transport system substrate-binding protein
MKKYLITFIIFVMVVSFAFAASGAAAPTVFKAAMIQNPQSLDGGFSTASATRQVVVYVFEELFALGEKYEIIPQLAESYEVSPDGLTYTIKLRKNIKFHDGSTFDAGDVKASYDRFVTLPVTESRFAGKMESVTIIDDYTIQFKTIKKMNLPEQLALPEWLTMIPKEIAEKLGKNEMRASDAIGTGPYKLVEWKPDVHVKLAKFAEYIPDARFTERNGLGGKRIATFDEILLIPVPEAESRMVGLELGEFDYAEAIPVTSYDRISKNTDITTIIRKPSAGIFLELNLGQAPMDDVRFRRALVLALDMDKVLQAVTSGRREFYRTDPSIFTPEQDYYTLAGSENFYNKPDINKVKQLLNEVGYKGEKIIYLTNKDYDYMYKASLSISEQWQAAGINAQLEFYDWPAQIKKAQSLKDWHVNQTAWSTRLTPSHLRTLLYSTSLAAYNYKNPRTDELIDKASEGGTAEEQKQIWEQIQKLVWDDVAKIKIGDYFDVEAIRADYKNYLPFYVIPRFWNVTK